VAGANRIEPVRLQDFDAPLFRTIENRGAENAVIVVRAAAFQLYRLSIDAQPVFDIDLDGADTK
jgi:hypothetical protein